MFTEKVQDDVNELVINVSLETDRIADIALASGPSEDVEFVTSFEEIRTRILDANTRTWMPSRVQPARVKR